LAEKPTTVKVASVICVAYGIITVLVMLSECVVDAGLQNILLTLLGIPLIVAGYGLWKMLKWGMYLGMVMGVMLIITGVYFLPVYPETIIDIVLGLVLLALIYVSRDSF